MKAALDAAKARSTKVGSFRGKLPTPADREAATAALRAAARARGADLAPIVAEIRAEGVTSANGIAKGLTARGIPTARGATTWSAVQVQRLLANIES